MTVSDLVLEILHRFGVSHMFGIPGDAINDVTDALRRQDRIRFIQVRHEEAGAFAASAQAKLTGRLGVCMGTAGPGAIHLLNGLYDAKMDHAPVLAITGNINTTYMGTEYHQEVDLYRLFAEVAVFNQVITTETQLPHSIVQACQKALAYNGVAHISLPEDIAGRRVSVNLDHIPIITRHGSTLPCEVNLQAATDILENADRIAILAGIGCRDAREELIHFADKLAAPVIRTLRAKDLLPHDHPLNAGGLGNLGSEPAVAAMENCDALVLAGTDFPYHEYFPAGIKAIQIDNEPARIGRRYPIDVGLRGDTKPTLAALTERTRGKADRQFLESIQKRVSSWQHDQAGHETSDKSPIRPQSLACTIGRLADEDALFICDTGAVTVWGARHLHIRGNQRFTLSSALASMAFALPGALGASLAYPGRQVIALCGDGGFSMLMADFVTAVKYQLPIKVVIFNNHKLGLIKMEQESAGLPEHETDLLNPDFAAYARSCGGEGITVTDPAELETALTRAYAHDGPVVVDVMVNAEEITLPPRIKAEQALNFGLAKFKEFVHGKRR